MHFLQGPPAAKWERETADGAGAAKTWGLRDGVLGQLVSNPTPAMCAIHARLALLYPEVDIAHMPAEHMHAPAAGMRACAGACQSANAAAPDPSVPGDVPRENACASAEQPAVEEAAAGLSHAQGSSADEPASKATGSSHAEGNCTAWQVGVEEQGAGNIANGGGGECQEQEPAVFCAPFVGNAAVAGDQYTWHVDADPTSFPDSRCNSFSGQYLNDMLRISNLLYQSHGATLRHHWKIWGTSKLLETCIVSREMAR